MAKERAILAGFHTVDAAEQAAQLLQQAGFKTVQVDQVGEYPGDGVEQRINPISGQIPSLGHLTLDAQFPNDRDASVLAAADPDASGMSGGGQENSGNILLTAVVPEERGSEAEEIIKQAGGVI